MSPFMPHYQCSSLYQQLCNELVCFYQNLSKRNNTILNHSSGSDDAVGPNLPSFAYGTRKDPVAKAAAEGVYSKEDVALGTIQEQSMVNFGFIYSA